MSCNLVKMQRQQICFTMIQTAQPIISLDISLLFSPLTNVTDVDFPLAPYVYLEVAYLESDGYFFTIFIFLSTFMDMDLSEQHFPSP